MNASVTLMSVIAPRRPGCSSGRSAPPATPASAQSSAQQALPRTPIVIVHVKNASDQPIYDAELYWRRGSSGWGDPNPESLRATIMPDDGDDKIRDFPSGSNMQVCGTVLRFTDTAGIRWLRRPDGYLSEIGGVQDPV